MKQNKSHTFVKSHTLYTLFLLKCGLHKPLIILTLYTTVHTFHTFFYYLKKKRRIIVYIYYINKIGKKSVASVAYKSKPLRE